MASAQSLLGLVNQLQSMEATFSTIMMEAVMKLASLTDTNVFLMVETAEGRRFCGKRHLCDQYLHGGGIAPIGNDIEMDVDVNVTGVREKMMGGGSLPPNYHHHSNSLGMQNWTNAQQANRKRPANYTNPSYSKHQKMAHQQQGLAGEDAHNKDHVKSETDRDRAAPADGDDRVVVDRENSMVEGEDPRSRDGGGGGGAGGAGDGGTCSAVAPWAGNIAAENAYQGFHGGMTSGPVANVNVNNEQLTIDFEKIDEEFSEFMQHDSKVSLLQAVTDPDTFLTPDSSIKRLLNSHLYDVSRLLSRRYYLPRKDPLTKKWFSDVFEKWWSSFPNLDKFESEGLKLPDRNRTPSIKSYARSRVHSWFGACLDRR